MSEQSGCFITHTRQRYSSPEKDTLFLEVIYIFPSEHQLAYYTTWQYYIKIHNVVIYNYI